LFVKLGWILAILVFLKKYKNIFGYTLLTIYAMVLLHNIIPHQHSSDQCPHHAHVGQDHDHDHAGHTGIMLSIFDMFDSFSHEGICVGHFENVLISKVENDLEVPSAEFCFLPNGFDLLLNPQTEIDPIESKVENWNHPPNLLGNEYVSSGLSHRGPPIS
jgi:hypothetical protein